MTTRPGNRQPESGSSTAEASAPLAKAKQAGSRSRNLVANTDLNDFFPCFPEAVRYRIETDPVTGRQRVLASPYDYSGLPYAWAVCHAGSWIHQRQHYVWVVGHKRHHIEPVRWIKSGRTVAFVPIHPYDVRGRAPVNRKDVVFAIGHKNGISIEPLKFRGRPLDRLSPIASERVPKYPSASALQGGRSAS